MKQLFVIMMLALSFTTVQAQDKQQTSDGLFGYFGVSIGQEERNMANFVDLGIRYQFVSAADDAAMRFSTGARIKAVAAGRTDYFQWYLMAQGGPMIEDKAKLLLGLRYIVEQARRDSGPRPWVSDVAAVAAMEFYLLDGRAEIQPSIELAPDWFLYGGVTARVVLQAPSIKKKLIF